MNYEGQICRGPMERSSYMLPVAVGCSYNRCKFCTLFRHLKYRELPMEQIEAELERVRNLGGNPKHVFLGDGNAFGLDTGRLLKITDLIHRYFPDCCAINMDATVTNIRAKSQEELQALRAAGIRHLYLGIESGLDDVLVRMEKDHNLDQAYRQIDRIQNAGFIYDAHIMTGIAGHGRGRENAYATAEFFNRTRPRRVINFSLFLSHSAPLYREAQAKTFVPATELENLQEERLLDILSKAEKLDDVITLEQALSEVRYEIESLTASLRRMDSQVAYSTLNIDLSEVVDYQQPSIQPKSFGERIAAVWSRSVERMGDIAEGLVLFAVEALPSILLFLVLPVLAILFIIRAVRRSRRAKRSKTASVPVPEPAKKED